MSQETYPLYVSCSNCLCISYIQIGKGKRFHDATNITKSCCGYGPIENESAKVEEVVCPNCGCATLFKVFMQGRHDK